jgi:DNA adenine methylase
MNYTTLSNKDLADLCKTRGLKKWSGKRKTELIAMLMEHDAAQAAAALPPSPSHSGERTEETSRTPESVLSLPSLPQTMVNSEDEGDILENELILEPTITQIIPYSQPIIKAYLETIHKKSGEGYRRVCLSPLRYAGGKSNAVGLILEHLPTLKSRKIVSPFFGGGSFEIAAAQQLGFQVIGYDIFEILVNFWQTLLARPAELADVLKTMTPTKEAYTRNRHILLHWWEQVKPATLDYTTLNRLVLTEDEKNRLTNDALQQAAYYYYNMQLSYGPMFLGWPSSVYLKPDRYASIVEKIRAFKAPTLEVYCANFQTAIAAHPDDFLFLDPPYYLGSDSKMFKVMYPNCNFAIHHNGFPHEELRDLLKTHKGGFLLTYNDCPTIRTWYAEFQQVFPSWQYTYSQGETRIGKNREEGTGDNKKESHEIFIICAPK